MTSLSPARAGRSVPSVAVGRIAGVAGIGSAAASVAWLVGARPSAAFPDAWIAVWNLLLLPVAAWLGVALVRSELQAGRAARAAVAAASALAGIVGCGLWATSWTRSDLEAVWIGLTAAWWLGTGALLASHGARWLGWLTLALGAFAALDATVTLLGDEGVAFLLASPKLPLAWLWSFVVGIRLIADPLLAPRPD